MKSPESARSDDLPEAPGSGPMAVPTPTFVQRMLPFLERYALVLIFVVVVIAFSAMEPDSFATWQNVKNILGNQSVLAIVALAAILPLIGGQFDLSVGSTVGISSIATAAGLSRFDLPLVIAVVVGVGLGALIGLVNGFVVAKIGVNALITTLGTAAVIAGVTSWYTEGQSITARIPRALTDLGSGVLFGLPRPIYVLAGAGVAVWYVVSHTPFGRYLQSVGSNVTSARLVGLQVDRVVIWSFVLAGALAGVAGVLHVGRAGGGNPQVGPNFMLPALSAAFLGATTIRPGRYNVPGTIVGVFFVAASVTGLSLVGVPYFIEPVFTGVALVTAVAASTLLARHRTGS